jgi:ferredoxin
MRGKKFWLDRKRTAAIARHTNAFKINEDVVIPLERMGEYTEGIERINVELSLRNKLELLEALEAMFTGRALPLGRGDDAAEIPGAELLEDRVQQALALLREVRAGWAHWLGQLDVVQPEGAPGQGETCFAMIQDGRWRASWKTQVLAPLQVLFSGAAFAPLLQECRRLHGQVLKGRVWVALHMHAGDGNVHTNIPVNSDNYAMLQTAHEAVARIMALARRLGGVISGEHGIGITKLEFLSDEELRDFAAYKARVDPHGHFNRGKLLRAMPGRPRPGRETASGRAAEGAARVFAADLSAAYTPSFGLMGHESLIMQRSEIGAISDSIKDCLRCGKCKPVCATHVPRANLLYSPRNKILATSLLIEAFLYEEQTRRGISVQHWEDFEDVADHCTVCHKCESPCPVKIDFGDVTMNMRNLLRTMGRKSFAAGAGCRHGLPQRHEPADHQGSCARRWWTRASRRSACCTTWLKPVGASPDCRAAGHARHRAHARAGHPLHQQEDARRAAEEDGTRPAGHRGPPVRPHHPRPEGHLGRRRGGLLLPGLRQRAPVQPGGRWPPRRCCGTRACRRCCRRVIRAAATPARRGPVRPGGEGDHGQPRALPPRGQHA